MGTAARTSGLRRVCASRLLLFAVMVCAAAPPAPASAQGGKFISIGDDPVLGDANAPVTIIEFSDYQCPFCRMFWKDTFPRLRKEYIETGTVKFVFRDFPQSHAHREATLAAMASECADDQGKYWEYHDKLFGEQDRRRRGTVVDLKASDLKKWAADIGVEPAAFAACLDSEKYKDEVAADFEDARALGFDGTPVFFVNGRLLAGAHPFDTFKKVIEEVLAQPRR